MNFSVSCFFLNAGNFAKHKPSFAPWAIKTMFKLFFIKRMVTKYTVDGIFLNFVKNFTADLVYSKLTVFILLHLIHTRLVLIDVILNFLKFFVKFL
jgi:hypothetical protein